MNRLSIFVLSTLIFCVATTTAQAQRPSANKRGATAAPPARPTRANPVRPAPVNPTSPTASVKNDDCGCEGTPLPDVVAVVNGVKITNAELDAQINDRIQELRKQVREARQQELDLQINTLLLEAEAKKRGISPGKLIDQEILRKAAQPTDAEALAFYNANKERINGDFTQNKNIIISYLAEQHEHERAGNFAGQLRTGAQISVLVKDVKPPANAQERAQVLALVNSQRLTAADVEESLKPIIFNVQQQVYQLRKDELDRKINDVLLEQEAQKQKVTTQALLSAEVTSKIKEATEAEARAFFDQNREQINGDFPQVKDQIVQYLKQQQQQQLESDFAARLRRSAALQIFLRAPVSPIFKVAIDDQPSRGNPSAPVTLIEFTDYQCPSCSREQPVLEKLLAEYGDRVRLVVRDFPLNQHENAMRAAEAAEAARAQGKYWEYTAILFNNQTALQEEKLKEYATRLGLDRQKFEAMLNSDLSLEKVRRDQQDGMKLGINATPTIFINGRRADDISYEGLKAQIEAALPKARS